MKWALILAALVLAAVAMPNVKAVSCNSSLTDYVDMTYYITAGEGKHFQVPINFTYRSGMRPDFSDLKPFAPDCTETPYWVKYNDSSKYADIIVKFPAINTSIQTIRWYYGNESINFSTKPTHVWPADITLRTKEGWTVLGGHHEIYTNNRTITFKGVTDNVQDLIVANVTDAGSTLLDNFSYSISYNLTATSASTSYLCPLGAMNVSGRPYLSNAAIFAEWLEPTGTGAGYKPTIGKATTGTWVENATTANFGDIRNKVSANFRITIEKLGNDMRAYFVNLTTGQNMTATPRQYVEAKTGFAIIASGGCGMGDAGRSATGNIWDIDFRPTSTGKVVTTLIDITPTVTMTSPTNTTYNTNSIELNWTTTNFNATSAWYELDGVNYTVEKLYNITHYQSDNTGAWNPSYPGARAYDGNWNTEATCSNENENCMVYLNYSLPINPSSIIWERKQDNLVSTELYNTTIPLSCVVSNTIRLRVNVVTNYKGSQWTIVSCYNSTNDLAQIEKTYILRTLYESRLYYSLLTNTTITVPDGTNHRIAVYANQTATVYGSLTVTFTVDATAPSYVNFTAPTASGNHSIRNIPVNVTATDAVNQSAIKIFLYNKDGILNNSYVCMNYTCFRNFTGLSDGKWFINATANDTANNLNSTETKTIWLDATVPAINIISPANISYVHDAITLNTTTNEEIDTWVYSLNGGANTSFTPDSTTISPTTGNNKLQVCANDTFNNMNCTTRSFIFYWGNFTVRILDEMTGFPTIALTNGNATLDIYCNYEMQRLSLITTSTSDILVNCSVKEMKLTLILGSTSQWRTLVPDSYTGNMSFYMINTSTYTSVAQAWSVFDVTNQYPNGTLTVTKTIENLSDVTIIKQNFDAENKILLYLIVGQRYCFRVLDQHGLNPRDAGCLYADTTTEKRLMVSNVPYKPEQNNIFEDIFITWAHSKGESYLSATYNDTAGKTTWVTMTVYNASSPNQMLYNTSAIGISFKIFNYTVNINHSYIVIVEGYQTTYGYFKETTTVEFEGKYTPGLPSELKWFLAAFAIIITFGIMMMFSKRNGKVGLAVGTITLAAFKFWGWFEATPLISWELITLLIFISVAAVLTRRGNSA